MLEDNLRVPSGVSYLLENRMVTKHVFPEMFRHYSIEPVDPYVGRLASMLASVSPSTGDPTIVVLTPGIYNSAYFEHAFLAQQLGVELVEGGDLVVLDDDCVYARTIDGLQRVDVIYRRIDDLYLDPEVFLPDSLLGVPGLIRAWKAGPGGPGQRARGGHRRRQEGLLLRARHHPLLPRRGAHPLDGPDPTGAATRGLAPLMSSPTSSDLVVKPANESGGYGVLVGSQASEDELAQAAKQIEGEPKRWVAQPIIKLSTAPTLCDGEIAPRHVDLRPFTLMGPEGAYVTRGGLTRVARRAGSLVVNSSQGGGSKDTWVVDTRRAGPTVTTAARAEGADVEPADP